MAISAASSATVDLTGEWPIVNFPEGRSVEFDDLRSLNAFEWRAIPREAREEMRAFLEKKGRKLTSQKRFSSAVGRLRTSYIHNAVSKGGYLQSDAGFGHWVYLNDPANRHAMDITIHVSNCSCMPEAIAHVKEWLADVMANGVDGVSSPQNGSGSQATLRVVAPEAPRRASA